MVTVIAAIRRAWSSSTRLARDSTSAGKRSIRLARIAQAFAAADEAEVAGHPGAAVGIRGLVENGRELTALRWWWAGGGPPDGISEEVWKHLLPEDQLAILGMLAETQPRQLSDPLKETLTLGAGVQAAFEVFLLVNGKSERLPPLSTWKVAADACGMDLMDYVMKMLGITEYQRDMTAGVALVETRQAGPVAMLLCEQAYWNRVMDGTSGNWGSVETAWKGFAQIESGYDLPGKQGRDYAGYLNDALAGGTAQGDERVFVGEGSHRVDEGVEVNRLQKAAEAAQDQAWRLIAGYKLAQEYGQDVTFFLNDEESAWWKYHKDVMDAGLVDYETNEERLARYSDQMLQDVRSEVSGSAWTEQQILEERDRRMGLRHLVDYPDPSTLEGSMEMMKTSYEYGNQYESNPPNYEADYHELKLENNHLYHKDVPDSQDLVMPNYAEDVYGSARGLETGRAGLPPLKQAGAYENHYRSLILVGNEYTEKFFASYYFPPEDPAHLPNYGTPIE